MIFIRRYTADRTHVAKDEQETYCGKAIEAWHERLASCRKLGRCVRCEEYHAAEKRRGEVQNVAANTTMDAKTAP